MPLRISVIVCAHNEARYLRACLHSVLGQTRPPDEVLVIDNASVDSTREIAERVLGVRVVPEPRKGLVKARETARLHAIGDVLVYLDADCRAPLTWLERDRAALPARSGAGRAVSALSLLRLGLAGPRPDPRLRPHGGAGHAAAGQARAAARHHLLRRQLRRPARGAGGDRRLRHEHRVSRRGHQPRPAPVPCRQGGLVSGLLALHLGPPLRGDGQGDRVPALRAQLRVGDCCTTGRRMRPTST